jgi:hypothetical protein
VLQCSVVGGVVHLALCSSVRVVYANTHSPGFCSCCLLWFSSASVFSAHMHPLLPPVAVAAAAAHCCCCWSQTSDAERIGVDQVAKILPSGRASGSEQRE